MKKEMVSGCLITAVISLLVIVFSYVTMNPNGRVWGMYGIAALYTGAIELLIGMVLVLIVRTRLYGAGILMIGLITLLIGNSICGGWIRL